MIEAAAGEELDPGQFGEVACIYDDLMNGVPYGHWMDYLELLWKWFQLRPERVLDLACGTGTVTHMLHQSGLEVAGVDLSDRMLEVARRKLPSRIPLWQQDLAELDLPDRQWDCAVCFFDSLNYILEPMRLFEAFGRIREHLLPGGAFIFDMNSPYALRSGMFDQKATNGRTGLAYRWRSDWDESAGICTIRMEFRFPDGSETRVVREVHRQRAYAAEDVGAMLRQSGFEVKGSYQAYTLTPVTARSDRFHVVAIRPR